MRSDRFVVTSYRPARRAVVVLAAALLIAAAAGVGYLLGGRDVAGELHAVRALERDLSRENSELADSNGRLRERVASLTRAERIGREALRRVEASLLKERELAVKREESLAFYRGILDHEDPSRRLRIHSLKLSRTPKSSRIYAFSVVLTQLLESDKVIEGSLDLSVDGDVEGLVQNKSLSDLSGGVKTLTFRFRHFQRVEGELTLPENFRPAQVHVRAVARDSGRVIRVSRAFGWDDELADTS